MGIEETSDSTRVSIACFGECMVELSGPVFGAINQSWGGDTYNTAVYLRRLLPDTYDVFYMTALGDDPLSLAMRNGWQHQGLRVDHVYTVPGKRPGLYQIGLDSFGERSFTYWRNDSAAKYVFDSVDSSELLKTLSAFHWFYLSGISLAILTTKGRQVLLSTLKAFVREGGNVVFDNNYRPALWENLSISQSAYREVMKLATIALLTDDDEYAHFQLERHDDIFDKWSCGEIVIKCGSEPCHIRYKGETTTVESDRVDAVVDTTAAGDSFAAAYLAARLLNRSVHHSATLAHRLAGRVIQSRGAVIAAELMEDIVA